MSGAPHDAPRCLWVITSYFNPAHRARRLANYHAFAQRLGAPLLTAELAPTGGGALQEGDATVLLRVSRGDTLWQKERLLNLALRALPQECDAVAWIDADLVFESPSWCADALALLARFPLVQLFYSVAHQPRDRGPDEPVDPGALVHRSIVQVIEQQGDAARCFANVLDRSWGSLTPGMAWAARRDLLDAHGFYDRCIVGGGDTAFACAAYGCPEVVMDLHRMNPAQRAAYQPWAAALWENVRGRVGVVPGVVKHLWHGELVDRGAAVRHAALAPFGFDPQRDIKAAPGEAWTWASDKPGLHAYLRAYFRSRQEDGRHAPDHEDPPPAADSALDTVQRSAVGDSPGTSARIVRLTGAFAPRIIVAQHAQFRRDYYGAFLFWVRTYVPSARAYFELHDLPCANVRWTDAALHATWLQDPVQAWCLRTYEAAMRLQRCCDARGVPVLNRVDRLVNATKLRGARLIAQAGLPTPRMEPITDAARFREDLLGLEPPLMVREDWDHWGPMVRADDAAQARAIDLTPFKRPVAVQIVDVRHPDGLCRKYRYIAAGDRGVAHHLQISSDWVTRGNTRLHTEQTRDEELAYVGAPDPYHALFQRARRALGLEFVAFDYGVDALGRMIVWEANPLPHIQFSKTTLAYRNHAIHATMLAMLRMYLDAGRLPHPSPLRDIPEGP